MDFLKQNGGNISHRSNAVELNNVTSSWSASQEHATMDSVSVCFKTNQICAVIGPVGCGKVMHLYLGHEKVKNGYFFLQSSLLHSILGEMPISSGFIEINGLISYAPQEPWVFSGSVRQNIIFGQSFDEDRYIRVLEVCALEYDLKNWKDHDNTLVGERGVILSG